MSVTRSLLLLLALLIILPLTIFTQANQPTGGDGSIQLSNLQLYQVEQGTVALTVDAIGTIDPAQSVSLSLIGAGRVDEIFVSRDQYVLAGDELVYLENDSQSIAYQQALLALTRAELAYEDLLTVDPNDILLAQAAVDSATGQYLSIVTAVSPADIEAADIAYEQALAAADQRLIERNTIGGQFAPDSVEFIQADARYGQATFDAEIARLQAQQLRNLNSTQAFAASLNIDAAEAELNRVLAGASQSELDNATIAIEQAQNQVDQAEIAFNNTILTAPFDGVITQLTVEEGALVAPGLTILEIMDVSSLGLTVQVDEIDIGLVQIGQPVRVTLDALPDIIIPATVTDIAPFGTPSGGIVSYAVDIELNGTDPRVRVGMTAEATIIIEETAPDVLFVPNLYIRRDLNAGLAFVNVLRDDDTIEEVEVTIGIQGREVSEITSGLSAGDLIAIDLSGNGLNILGGN